MDMPVIDQRKLLKIQYGELYIQLPVDNLEAIDYALAYLQFMRKIVEEELNKNRAPEHSDSEQKVIQK